MVLRYRTVHLAAWLVPALIALVALALPAGAFAATPGGIAGSVTGEGAGALAGVEVCAYGVEGTATAEEVGCADTSSPSGSYEIINLSAGNYVVEFDPPPGIHFVYQFWNHAATFSEATEVTVTAGSTTPGINAQLEKEGTISGTVTAAATGLPAPGVAVCAYAEEEELCAKTNSAGQYTILGLTAGMWSVYFYPEGTGQELVAQPYPTPVSVAPHAAVTGINAALQKGGAIEGTVRLAATGAPLSGVRVCLVDSAEVYTYGCLTSPVSGRYRFYGLPGLSFKVAFSPEASELVGPETSPEKASGFAGSPDAYPTQWWNAKSSFASADPIAITPPNVVSGIDGSLGPPAVVSPPPAPPAPVAVIPKKQAPLICHKGFAKRKVKGKLRCVKQHKKHHHRRHHKKHRHG